MDDPRSIDERLAAMKPRESEPSWEEKGMVLLSDLKRQYREHPVNMVCMLVFGAVLLVGILYGVSYIIPINDPAYG